LGGQQTPVQYDRERPCFYESVEEWRFLDKTIQTMQTSEYFIGLKKQSGERRWVSKDKNKSSSGRYLYWAPYQPSGNGNCAKMFTNSYYLGYDDISGDQRKRGIGYICERANECNDEKGMVQEGGALFMTLLISFKYDLNSLQKFGKCSFLPKAKI